MTPPDKESATTLVNFAAEGAIPPMVTGGAWANTRRVAGVTALLAIFSCASAADANALPPNEPATTVFAVTVSNVADDIVLL
jgi:hypothetical protein